MANSRPALTAAHCSQILIYFLLALVLVRSHAAQQVSNQDQQQTQNQFNNNNNNNAQVQQAARPQSIGQRQSQPTQPGADDEYLIGVGIADITGPSADINLMGYAKPNQDAGGIHLRQFSRALIVEDQLGSRLLYVNLDNGMISQLLRTRLLSRLKADFGEHTFNESNVMLSARTPLIKLEARNTIARLQSTTATHTHSCPGGFFQYMLYNIPSAGFISQTLEALVEGIARSVRRAHSRLEPGRMFVTRGELLDASVNRSPTSYANNPAQERAQYAHDTDKQMTLLRLVDRQGKPLGMLNWFAVHGTSMNNTNHLISSDNKGYAALLMEAHFNGPHTAPGQGKFVAMFAQANEGDVSPNTRGPRCIDSGLPCELASSTCGNPPRNEKCIASGPGKDMFESTKIIAHKQFMRARQLFLDESSQRPVRGPIRYVHQHIDMTKQQVALYDSLVELNKRHASETQMMSQQQQQQQQSQMLQAVRARRRQDKQSINTLVAQPILPHQVAPPVQPVQPPTPIPINATYQTCLPGLGYSFAAGTTDGPGAFDFQQGDTASTRYWNMVRDFLRRPSEEQLKCHHPKPILLSTGEMDFPYMWHPKVVPTQIFMIGQVAIVGLPGEFTTMSGRRVRAAVQKQLEQNQLGGALDFSSYHQLESENAAELELESDEHNDSDEDSNDEQQLESAAAAAAANKSTSARGEPQRRQLASRVGVKRLGHKAGRLAAAAAAKEPAQIEVILSGLSNIYTSYITTLEEYEMQRYEGASTLYGPHTLQAYLEQFKYLASLLKPDQSGRVPIDDSLQPPDLSKSLFTLKAGVIYDGAPHNKNFGQLLEDVDTKRVYRCRELVSAVFVAGNPRNDLRQEQSFLYVDKLEEESKSWRPIATDASWETKFIWERTNTLFGESKATIQWEIPDQCQPGVYRIRHYGAHKSLLQTISQYAGKSSPFRVAGAEEFSWQQQQANDSSQNSSQADLLHLDQLMQLAEQLEASQASQQHEQVVLSAGGQFQASQPKSDTADATRASKSERPTLAALLAAPFKYLGSLVRPWNG